MAAFTWLMIHFATVADFEAWLRLNLKTRPAWCRGITLHHTWKPTIAQWTGQRSMEALGRYYRSQVLNSDGTKGWPQGPHLFIGPDGIWLGCPLVIQGVHAGPCNANHWGIEVVGDYDQVGWAEPIKSLVYGVVVALCRAAGFDEDDINGHRDCMPGHKSCPGNAINLAEVRRWVGTLLELPANRPAGTFAVAPRFAAYWDRSGQAWQKDRATLGWAITPEFRHTDGQLYQLFERGGLRWRDDGRQQWIESMLTREVEDLKRERAA